MKIGKTPNTTGAAASSAASGAGSAQRSSAGAQAGGTTAAGSSTVTLSPQLSQLQSALALAGSGEVFDAKQVASIKQAISNGQFQVNPEKVADNLLQSVHEMINARTAQQGA